MGGGNIPPIPFTKATEELLRQTAFNGLVYETFGKLKLDTWNVLVSYFAMISV